MFLLSLYINLMHTCLINILIYLKTFTDPKLLSGKTEKEKEIQSNI